MLKVAVHPHSPQPSIVFKLLCLFHISARSNLHTTKRMSHQQGGSKIDAHIYHNFQLLFLAQLLLFVVVYERFVETAMLLSANGNFQ